MTRGSSEVEPVSGLWLVVPVKPFGEGKSRLAPVLEPAERADLMRSLLEGVLAAAVESGVFDGIAVISRDANVLAAAAHWGARTVRENGNDLNAALEQARTALVGADALMVLPADLPDISAQGIRDFVGSALELDGQRDGAAFVVLSPSMTGGTNALLLAPPDAIPFAYGAEDGRESAERHARLAEQRGVAFVSLPSIAFAVDVDKPVDYQVLQFMRQLRPG